MNRQSHNQRVNSHEIMLNIHQRREHENNRRREESFRIRCEELDRREAALAQREFLFNCLQEDETERKTLELFREQDLIREKEAERRAKEDERRRIEDETREKERQRTLEEDQAREQYHILRHSQIEARFSHEDQAAQLQEKIARDNLQRALEAERVDFEDKRRLLEDILWESGNIIALESLPSILASEHRGHFPIRQILELCENKNIAFPEQLLQANIQEIPDPIPLPADRIFSGSPNLSPIFSTNPSPNTQSPAPQSPQLETISPQLSSASSSPPATPEPIDPPPPYPGIFRVSSLPENEGPPPAYSSRPSSQQHIQTLQQTTLPPAYVPPLYQQSPPSVQNPLQTQPTPPPQAQPTQPTQPQHTNNSPSQPTHATENPKSKQSTSSSRWSISSILFSDNPKEKAQTPSAPINPPNVNPTRQEELPQVTTGETLENSKTQANAEYKRLKKESLPTQHQKEEASPTPLKSPGPMVAQKNAHPDDEDFEVLLLNKSDPKIPPTQTAPPSAPKSSEKATGSPKERAHLTKGNPERSKPKKQPSVATQPDQSIKPIANPTKTNPNVNHAQLNTIKAGSDNEWVLMEDDGLLYSEPNVSLQILTANLKKPIVQKEGATRERFAEFKVLRGVIQKEVQTKMSSYFQQILPKLNEFVETETTFSPLATLSDSLFSDIKNRTWTNADTWVTCVSCASFFGVGEQKLICKLCSKTFCPKCGVKTIQFSPSALGMAKPANLVVSGKGCKKCRDTIQRMKRRDFVKNSRSGFLVEHYQSCVNLTRLIKHQVAFLNQTQENTEIPDKALAINSKIPSANALLLQLEQAISAITQHSNQIKKQFSGNTSQQIVSTYNQTYFNLIQMWKFGLQDFHKKTAVFLLQLQEEYRTPNAEQEPRPNVT